MDTLPGTLDWHIIKEFRTYQGSILALNCFVTHSINIQDYLAYFGQKYHQYSEYSEYFIYFIACIVF